ncbi:MAG: methyltransferase domain-containing protein [Pseudomonadales bacterium]|nr:methyltransferase domain-containing protein [Pseudomonadales bacterium]
MTQAPIAEPAFPGLFEAMGAWFESPLGRELLKTESSLLESLLLRRFGYHLLQVGCSNIAMYGSSPIGHKFSLVPDPHNALHMAVAKVEALPLASESIDLVLLHHALDFSGNQHQLLREASRILIAGGHILIVGFNPLSSWGIRNKIPWQERIPWNARLLSTLRISDWLKLLDFQVERIDYGAYFLPWNNSRAVRYSALINTPAARLNWPTGGIYVISAKKQRAPLTPIRNEWKTFPVAVGLPVTDNVAGVSNIHSQSQQQE